MRPEVQSEEAILRYLLGESPDQERQQIEDEYFDDPDFLAQIDAVEADMIDRYVLGSLSADERNKFEQHVLNSHSQRRKVDSAREFSDLIEQEREPSPSLPDVRSKGVSWWEPLFNFFRLPKFSLGLAAAALVMALGCGWLIVERISLRHQLERTRTERDAQRQREQALLLQHDEKARTISELRERISSLETKVPSPVASILSFLLKPSLSRNIVGERGQVTLPPGTNSFELKLQLPPSVGVYSAYQVTVETGDGKEIIQRPAKGKRIVTVVMPASKFNSQVYILTLRGKNSSGEFEEAGIYPFVVKK